MRCRWRSSTEHCRTELILLAVNFDFDFNSLTTNSIPDFLKNHGVPKISDLKVMQEDKSAIVPVSSEITWLQAFLSYETPEGRGKGFLRLRETTPGSGDWKAYTFFVSEH